MIEGVPRLDAGGSEAVLVARLRAAIFSESLDPHDVVVMWLYVVELVVLGLDGWLLCLPIRHQGADYQS